MCRYAEAHEVQTQAQEMEIHEREKYMEERNKKVITAEATLITKQQNEMNALKKKLETNLNERLKLRETEHSKLLQRYHNVKKEIDSQQQIEKIKFEKQNQNAKIGVTPKTQVNISKLGQSPNKSKLGSGNKHHSPASKPSHHA